jgi:hypothetical protein
LLLREHGGCSLRNNLSPFPLLEHHCSLGQHKRLLLQEHGFLRKIYFWTINLKELSKNNFFSSISFMDEKNNSEKGWNLRPLGYKGDFNYCINFFPLKTM